MKAMLWKELRENFKWALLAMIGLGLAEIYGLYYVDQMNYYNPSITLCKPTFLMATSFGNALVGLLLGFVQILPEQRRDQWAALLHRPVSRATIFRGKALAGLLLYIFSTVPPFLLCLWLAATPGHFVAPFVPELILPGVSDICVGAAYYFAALVVALQRGSWFGARTFALLAAVYVSANVSDDKYFFVAVAAGVVVALVLFTAAWGAMLSNGKLEDRPWLAKGALLASVFYGVCGLGILGTILLAAGQKIQPYIGSQYGITQDGQPILVTVNKELATTVTDLAGNVIHDDRFTGRRAYENEIRLSELTYYINDDHGYKPGDQYYNYRLGDNYVQEISLNSELASPTEWFYLYSAKYAVGIDRQKKAPVEIADVTGFKAFGAPIEPFSGTRSHWYDQPCLIQEGTDAITYDLEKETRTLLPSADNSPILGLQLLSYLPQNGKGYDIVSVIAREQGLQVYDSKNAPIVSIPYDPQVDLSRWGTVQFGVGNALNRFYVEYSPGGWVPWDKKDSFPQYLSELDSKGNVLHSYVLPPLPGVSFPRSWDTYVRESLRAPAFWFSRLAKQKIGAVLGIDYFKSAEEDSFHTHWGAIKDVSKRVAGYSLFFALIALGWARWAGMSWRRAWAWAGFVFAFNLGGLITFRLVADWPVQVPCPKCGGKRLVEETACRHCQAGWPAPELRGIEILDDKAPNVMAEYKVP
jgi:hypothetical protein